MKTHWFIGSSSTIRQIEQDIDCAVKSDATVLITGETGVGKEVVARLIHDRSPRRRKPLVAINCAGGRDSLLEQELFGHVRGSLADLYRGKRGRLEGADGGTIFVDQVGEMSLRTQALLLRFLETGKIQRVGSTRVCASPNVRVIAATPTNLRDRVADQRFREDLFYRLNVVHLQIAPLRERVEDISFLFEHFVRLHCVRHGIEPPVVQDATIARLNAYSWPGNVRQIKHVIEELIAGTRSGVITPADLSRAIADGDDACASSADPTAQAEA